MDLFFSGRSQLQSVLCYLLGIVGLLEEEGDGGNWL